MCARTTNPVARLAARVYHAQLIAEVKKATGNDKIEFLPLDLDSLASARQCAELFLARALPLHLLIANAGIGATGLTVDGFERQFQVNYLGHFLLVVLLLDVLKSSAPSRIVLVSSSAYNLAREVSATEVRELPRAGSASSTFRRYCSAKLAMIWFMQELTARLEHTGVLVHAVESRECDRDHRVHLVVGGVVAHAHEVARRVGVRDRRQPHHPGGLEAVVASRRASTPSSFSARVGHPWNCRRRPTR